MKLKYPVLLALFSAFSAQVTAQAASVVINEVDADQSGTDSAEFIELYDGGVGNTLLDGLSIVLFNGSDDKSYLAYDLDNLTTNDSGYFVLCANAATTPNCDLDVFPDTNLIQNGADAVALYATDALSFPNDTVITMTNLIDAIVYDTDDSDDVGLLQLLNGGEPQVNEDGNGAKDTESNQRCENGTGGELNTSSYEQYLPTPGTENVCTAVPVIPDVIINEVDSDTPGTDSAEFIELFGPANTDLSGLSIVFYNGSNDASYAAFDLDGLSTDENGYFVFCGNAANTMNCDLDVLPDTNLIQNGADAVALVVGDASNFPNDTAVSTVNLLDAFVYDTNDSDDAALLVLLNPEQAQINEDENGSKDTESNQRCFNGSGGARNTDTYQQHEPTPGAANTCGIVPPTDIVINEVDADQISTDAAEFVELFGPANTDLNGLSIVFYNGSDDASYEAFDLDGMSTDENGYFVLCGDATNTANCDMDVSPNTNLIQNGPDAVALVTGNAADYPNDTPVSTANLVDAFVYGTSDADDAGLLVLLNAGQPQIDENGSGSKDTHSNQRCSNGNGGARNTESYAQYAPTPGTINVCGGDDPEPVDLGICTDAATFIHEVQGNGAESPMVGQSVIVEGVVTAVFQSPNQIGGFFMQEEDGDADADATTSEGIFVFNTSNLVTLNSVVRVQGNIDEFFGLTQMKDVTGLLDCGTAVSPTASSLTLPLTSLGEYEQVEGMSVFFSQPLTVTEYFNLDRFGQITLSDERTYQFTHNSLPDETGYAAHLANKPLNQIMLDDGSSSQNPEIISYFNPTSSATNTLRGGSIANIAGVMSYSFGNYVIHPTDEILFADVNPRTVAPNDLGGNFKVAGINVLNYFTTLDVDGSSCGPNALDCRGAENAEEFTRQRDKTIAAISIIDADVLGLVEVENNATESLSDLVNGLNAVVGEGTYAYVNTGTIGSDAIKVGLIYKPAAATPTGAFAILDSSVDPLFIDDKNRPALAQTFTTASGDEVFTVVVNHLKSKGSSCDSVGDTNANDGQGNCAGVRANAATALVNWLATDPTTSGDDDFLILGDLNAYAKEDAITNITGAGYTNLIEAFGGATAYSYVFDGELGYLDHALSSVSLTEKVSGVTEWHINSDEPDAFDYNTNFRSADQIATWYSPDAYRMSDHDPVIVGLNLDVVPRHKNECKKDGWQNLRRTDGTEFRNQGQCVKYVNTGK